LDEINQHLNNKDSQTTRASLSSIPTTHQQLQSQCYAERVLKGNDFAGAALQKNALDLGNEINLLPICESPKSTWIRQSKAITAHCKMRCTNSRKLLVGNRQEF
jgi:hypothetical protein